MFDASQMRKISNAINAGQTIPPAMLAAYNRQVQNGQTSARPTRAAKDPTEFNPDAPFGMDGQGPAQIAFKVDASGGSIKGPVVLHKIATKTVSADDGEADTILAEVAFSNTDQKKIGGGSGGKGRKLRSISVVVAIHGTLPEGYATFAELEKRLGAGRFSFVVDEQEQGNAPLSALHDTGHGNRYALVDAQLDSGNFEGLMMRVESAAIAPLPDTGDYTVEYILECTFDPKPNNR